MGENRNERKVNEKERELEGYRVRDKRVGVEEMERDGARMRRRREWES